MKILTDFCITVETGMDQRRTASKNMEILESDWQDRDFYLLEEPPVLPTCEKHKYWLTFSNPSLNCWTYFPKDCRWIGKP